MPDWTNYSFRYTTGTSASAGTFAILGVPFTANQIQQEYEEWERENERQDRIWELQMQMHQQQMEQQAEEEKQLIKDKERYPLFFLKEGIV